MRILDVCLSISSITKGLAFSEVQTYLEFMGDLLNEEHQDIKDLKDLLNRSYNVFSASHFISRQPLLIIKGTVRKKRNFYFIEVISICKRKSTKDPKIPQNAKIQ
jgi:hypothetical protein